MVYHFRQFAAICCQIMAVGSKGGTQESSEKRMAGICKLQHFYSALRSCGSLASAKELVWMYPPLFSSIPFSSSQSSEESSQPISSFFSTGYGNIAPSTEGGKIFCILYAIFGIPLFGFLLAGIGDQLGTIFGKSIARVEKVFRVRLSHLFPPTPFLH